MMMMKEIGREKKVGGTGHVSGEEKTMGEKTKEDEGVGEVRIEAAGSGKYVRRKGSIRTLLMMIPLCT